MASPTDVKEKNGGAPAGGGPMHGGPRGGSMRDSISGLKKNKETIRRLLGYVTGRYTLKLITVFSCILLSAIAGVIGSLFLETLIDDYITPLMSQPNPVFSGLFKAIMIMAGIYLVGVATALAYNRIMAVVTHSVLKDIRDEMFSKMQKLPIKYFDTYTHGDIMSHYTNDADTLRQMISQSIPQVFSAVITMVTVFISMLITSLWLTLFVVVTVVIMMAVTGKVGGKSAGFFVKQQNSLASVNGFIEEIITGQKVVKVFCHEEKVKDEFDKRNDELCDHATKANLYANILMPIMMNMGHLQYVLIAILGGAFAVLGVEGLTLGAIAAFLQLSRSFTRPIGMVSQQVNAIVMALAGAGRIFKLMDEEPEKDNGTITLVNAKYAGGELVETQARTGVWAWKQRDEKGETVLTEVKGDVEFIDVDFGYTANKQVLYDVTIYANPGQKVALVGATGAGKTTITNLLNRFYDIADGQILYDGIDITKIKKDDLRRSMGIVLQDTNLFSGTVMENIRYGKLDATDEEIYAAAKLANADGFIQMLPQGYDTVLTNNGSGLSQGQRQLLAIARAAVANPPVMVLDEATSSIDTRTEAIVQRGMDSLMDGRTVFVIAHRLSTVQNADVIMVLELGHIIERGNHDRLIALKGQYYQLYTGVFELE